VFSFMSKDPQEELAEALCDQTPEAEHKRQILASLNEALGKPGLYNEQAFGDPKVSDKGAELLGRDPNTWAGDEVRFLNRELLVSAWPNVIAPSVRLEMPPGYEIRYAGEKEEQDKASAFLSKAFGIALLLVTMVLVIQFNSLMIPLIIMTTVVLSLIGALAGLLICDLPFGIIMTGLGIISLAGVVVNNAIVLLAYTRQLQKQGMELVAAAAEAGVTRFRPVLLTAATTIIGLIPMAIGISYDFHAFSWATKSESSQWWRNMAVVVIFGLGFATVLTLVVVPSLYVMLSRLSHRMGFHSLDTEIPAEQQPPPGSQQS